MPKRQRIRISAVNFATLAQKQRILKTALSPQAPRISLQGESIMEVVPSPEDSEKITLSPENLAEENKILHTGKNTSDASLFQ
jgi:hypothetical protein